MAHTMLFICNLHKHIRNKKITSQTQLRLLCNLKLAYFMFYNIFSFGNK